MAEVQDQVNQVRRQRKNQFTLAEMRTPLHPDLLYFARQSLWFLSVPINGKIVHYRDLPIAELREYLSEKQLRLVPRRDGSYRLPDRTAAFIMGFQVAALEEELEARTVSIYKTMEAKAFDLRA